MKKIYLFLLVILFVGLASATLPPVKQYDCVQLRTISNSTTVTLSTITYPNETILEVDSAMTQSGKTFNYSFCNTYLLGEYVYDYYTNDGKVYVNNFEVTPSGFENNIGYYIFFLLITLGMVLFGYYTQDYWLVILGGFGTILLGLYILFYGIAGMKDTAYTWGVGIITLMIGAYFAARASMEQL